MNRRDFFKKVVGTSASIVVAPAVITSNKLPVGNFVDITTHNRDVDNYVKGIVKREPITVTVQFDRKAIAKAVIEDINSVGNGRIVKTVLR